MRQIEAEPANEAAWFAEKTAPGAVPRKLFLQKLAKVTKAVSDLVAHHPTVSPSPFVAFVNFCKNLSGRLPPRISHLGLRPSRIFFTMAGTSVSKGIPLNFPSVEIVTTP